MAYPIGPFRKMPLGGGARFPPFFPLSLPNLELYLDSRLGIAAADGASINPWLDQSGHARNAGHQPGFTDPKVARSGTNLTPKGKPSVVWSALITALGSAPFAWPAIGLRGYTFYWYGRAHAKSAPPYASIDQVSFTPATTYRPGLSLSTFDPDRYYGFIDDGGGNFHKFGTELSIDNQWAIHSLVMPLPDNNTVNARYYVNGVQKSQIAGPANYLCADVGVDGYMVGGETNQNTSIKAEQSVQIWYSDTHSAATVAKMALWAGIFFGLS